MNDQTLKLFGTQWCIKSTKLRNYLQSIWVTFEDYNVETNAEAEKTVRSFYNGELKFPTLSYGSDFLKNPSISEVNDFLKKFNLK
ncbi:glutaredoxin domain-containing protein [Aquimarina gracilis]|uniref:Glutaredoxin domain-containing protein n=1 Tax=Aquimarina gracilis TaxID=874422 RepID=A0ABU5ZSZ0_9FLAO|nr:glutaredoxin domain-containing protein [Aquimarina gracilis]MEB3345103.1 glutaredoxin domain-containing protein [Aquimarina gracilis]